MNWTSKSPQELVPPGGKLFKLVPGKLLVASILFKLVPAAWQTFFTSGSLETCFKKVFHVYIYICIEVADTIRATSCLFI